MKNNKVLIIIVVVILNIVVGFFAAQTLMGKKSDYEIKLDQARAYAEQNLCSKSIASYQEVIALKDSAAVRCEMVDVYDKGLEIGEFTKKYAVFSDVDLMIDAFRDDLNLYEKIASLNLKYENYENCAKILMQARDFNLSSDLLTEIKEQIRYRYQKNYSMYTQVAPMFDGAYAVVAENVFSYLKDDGSTLLNGNFTYASSFNEGYAVVKRVNPEGTEQMFVIDKTGARQFYFPETAETSSGVGVAKNSDGEKLLLLSVKDGEKYMYYYLNGEKAFGDYQFAGRFRNNVAAVQDAEGHWSLINGLGERITETTFEDVVCNEFDECAPKGLILAKKDGKYHIYNLNVEQVGTFACDGAKAFVNDLAAFRQGDLWGYVDQEGNVVIEPQYEDAKSFSNGLGAVKVGADYFGVPEETAEEFPTEEWESQQEVTPAEEAPEVQSTADTSVEAQEPETVTADVNEEGLEAGIEVAETAIWAIIDRNNNSVFNEGFEDTDYLSDSGVLFVKADGYWSYLTMFYKGE